MDSDKNIDTSGDYKENDNGEKGSNSSSSGGGGSNCDIVLEEAKQLVKYVVDHYNRHYCHRYVNALVITFHSLLTRAVNIVVSNIIAAIYKIYKKKALS